MPRIISLLALMALFGALAVPTAFSDEYDPYAEPENLGDLGESSLDVSGSSRVYIGVAMPEWLIENAPSPVWNMVVSTDVSTIFSSAVVEARLNGTIHLEGQKIDGQIYEAYLLARPTDWLDISLGQKRLAFGHGGSFNPGDSLHPLEAMGVQKTGFRGAIIRASIGQDLGVAVAVSADRVIGPGTGDATGSQNLADLTYAATLDWHIERLNVGLAWFYAYERLNSPMLWLSYDLDGINFSAEGSYDLNPTGTRVSTGASVATPEFTALEDPQLNAVLSIRWQNSIAETDLNATVEYLYRQQGWTNDDTTTWQSAYDSASASGMSGMIGHIVSAMPFPWRNQHYLWATFGASQQGLAGINAAVLLNLQDISATITVASTIQLVENVDIEVQILTCLAEQTSDEYYRTRNGVISGLLGLTMYW